MEFQTRNFETSLGVIPVTAKPDSFGRKNVAMLAITGAYAPPPYMSQVPLLGEAAWDGFLARLPGNQTPTLSETSIRAFSRAFDEVVEQLDRPVAVCGVSVGGLVALGMKKAGAILALEPFLSTGELWALWPTLIPGRGSPQSDLFLDSIFGITVDGVVDRSYHYLLDELSVPAEVIVGDDPMHPKRDFPEVETPSLVSEEDREAFARHPLVTLLVAQNAGHNVWWDAGRFVYGRMHEIAKVAAARPAA